MNTSERFELKLCRTKDDLIPVHKIREAILFKGHTYNCNHPDDQHPNNHNFVFLMDGKPVAVVRLDFLNPADSAVRLVAVLTNYQGQGIGSRMLRDLEAYAQERNVKKLFVNSRLEAKSFYESHGFVEGKWDDPGEGTSRPTMPMVKIINDQPSVSISGTVCLNVL